jgi:hypothetical protein
MGKAVDALGLFPRSCPVPGSRPEVELRSLGDIRPLLVADDDFDLVNWNALKRIHECTEPLRTFLAGR